VKLFWMATAAVCIVIAAALMWRRDFNTAFVIAIVGIVAWFLNYRIQMKRITAAADAERDREMEETDE
jgi:Na+/proline symporter